MMIIMIVMKFVFAICKPKIVMLIITMMIIWTMINNL